MKNDHLRVAVLGAGKWGIGPSGVVLTMSGPWVYGVLLSNVWSVAFSPDGKRLATGGRAGDGGGSRCVKRLTWW